MVKMLASSLTASPIARCFSVTTPSMSAWIS